MVKLSEVTDEHFEEVQQGPIPSDNDDDFEEYSDTDSEADLPNHPHSHQHPQQKSSAARKPGAKGAFVTDADSSDSESDEDEDESGLTLEESLYERLVALKDMIPIKQRTKVGNFVNGVWGWVTWGVKGGGSVMYVVSTGMLMLGVPYALAVAEEGQMLEIEREMKLQQQANELIQAPGSGQQQQQGGIQIR